MPESKSKSSSEASTKDITPLQSFFKERKYIRARITRLHGLINLKLDSLSEVNKHDYHQRLLEYKKEITDVNKRIHQILPEEDFDEVMLDNEEEYDDLIGVALNLVKPPKLNNMSGDLSGRDCDLGNVNRLRLPNITLPVFSNDKNESLEKFIFAFEAIIDKHNLSNYEKFVYLKGQLSKAPLTLVNSLDSENQTYAGAKELLTEAFASPLSQKYDVIRKLSELKLTNNGDVYEFISEMRCIISSFKALKIDVDTIIQFFVWFAMNDRFQSQIIQITNNTKPTLEEINKNIFSATDRYLRMNEQYNERRAKQNNQYNAKSSYDKDYNSPIETNNLAIRINNKPTLYCILCKADGKRDITHVLRECNEYPNPSDKVRKLDQLNYCSICSFMNHNKSQCEFKFASTCRSCDGPHWTFLCMSKKSTSNSNSSVVSNLSCVHFNSTVKDENVLLPSFTVGIDKDNSGNTYRVLNDTGSQRNFILEDIADRLNLRIVREDVDMVIHGFNSQRLIKTNIVSVPLRINSELFDISAIVVPSIDININVHNLKLIADNFLAKGYTLADERLGHTGSEITGFSLVMGPDAIKCLRPRTEVIGHKSDYSVYLKTGLGVLLLGESYSLLRNLKYLKYSENNIKSLVCESVYGENLEDKSLLVENKACRVNCDKNVAHVNASTVQEILDDKGEIIQSKLSQATDEMLECYSDNLLSYDRYFDAECSDVNNKILNYVLSNIDRTPEGRLIMNLPWNPECKELLGCNFNLSKKILYSNFNKLKKDNKITMYDEVFQEQEKLGIIERVEDVSTFMKQHPDCSFIPHMGVFKMSRETTKVRVVYLSNLCEKNKNQPNAVSHNNALMPGPCLNSKLSTSLLLSRFNKYMLIFDISKAFLGIELNEYDQRKLMCLWFKSVKDNDYSLIAYKNLRLSFGLRPSPTILMIALYKLLILDIENDDRDTIELKQMIYNGIYMDNGIVSTNDVLELKSYYKKLPNIFGDYKWELQQYATNELKLQAEIDKNNDTLTEGTVKFFGIQWNREEDSFSPFPINLDSSANTKRKVLSSLNSVFDLFNVYGPILNRAKLYFQKLQSQNSLDWDSCLNSDLTQEWVKICKQANATLSIKIPRFVGSLESTYTLVAFSDASAAIYGTVVYIIDNLTGKVSFVLAKNKVINSKLAKKTIPSLECQGVSLAAEVLVELCQELGAERNVLPIEITKLLVYTDSMVTLAWIRNYYVNYEKMQKHSVFLLNRLRMIGDLSNKRPITFRYIEGRDNPADFISRPISYNRLQKTNYLTGPKFLQEIKSQPDIEVSLPNYVASLEAPVDFDGGSCASFHTMAAAAADSDGLQCRGLVQVEKFSSFRKVVGIYANIFKFICRLKLKVPGGRNSGSIFKGEDVNFIGMASNFLISSDQFSYFPDIFRFFKQRTVQTNKIPNLVLQMNLYMDENFVIRVRGKFSSNRHPILLYSNSYVSKLIVLEIHNKFSHAGLYTVLRELRKEFWLLRGFSTVRKILKQCIVCKKINELPIKLNQNSYREFRCDPPKIPFSYVFIDHIGPINVRLEEKVKKVWILIITCLWSRAISLQLSNSADTAEFLRCLQIHIYQYGMFALCLSDLGSQITAGANIISNFLNDFNCIQYFQLHGITKLTFQQYAKGNSSLGSLVENCVKQTKSLIVKSIGRTILEYSQFQLLLAKVNHVVNRRPVAFQDALRDSEVQSDIPEAITPEMLLHGRELLSLNIVPNFQPCLGDYAEYSPVDEIRQEYSNLSKCNARLMEAYHEDFLVNLVSQAVNIKDRYKPVTHKKLSVGDIVLLVEPQTKRNNYPMGLVRKVIENSLGEVTSAVVFKGKTREEVFRHSSSLILILHGEDDSNIDNDSPSANRDSGVITEPVSGRPRRQAAMDAQDMISSMYQSDCV